jgi:hypothetical protein
MSDTDYVVVAAGSPIRVCGTARGALQLLDFLDSPRVTVQPVRREWVIEALRREAARCGVDCLDAGRIVALMGEILAAPLGDETYLEKVCELAFRLPFLAVMDWQDMALEYLKSQGWQDDRLPEGLMTAPETLYATQAA